jgi:hypothetical protein
MKPLMRGIATLGATGAIILGLSGQAWALAVPPGCPLLASGYQGDCVRELQKELNDPDLAVDGIFGPATERSVKGFQDDHALIPDGVVGPGTKGELGRANSVDSPRPKPLPQVNGNGWCPFGTHGGNGKGCRGGSLIDVPAAKRATKDTLHMYKDAGECAGVGVVKGTAEGDPLFDSWAPAAECGSDKPEGQLP